jgi:hypothetical protein
LGKWDGRKILGKGFKEECIRFMYLTLEVIMGKCKELGVTKFSVILNNDGLTLWKVAHLACKLIYNQIFLSLSILILFKLISAAIECTIKVIKDFESNYPETLLAAYLVNSKS